MIELALVFGRATPARFAAARPVVLWLPLMCDGLLEACDLAYRSGSGAFVAVARLSREEPAVAARVAFWTWRAGGRATLISGLAERTRSAYHFLLASCDRHERDIAPGRLAVAVARVAAVIGLPSAPASVEPMVPTLLLGDEDGWDGAAFDRDRGRLFLPFPMAPALGDELALRLRFGGTAPVEARGRVVELARPGQRGPGLPAGFVLALQSPRTEVCEALARRVGGPGAGRAAPRYPVRAPVRVRPEVGEPVAHLAYSTEEQLHADWVANLSQGGAFVRTARPLPPGAAVRLEMQLPGGAVLEAPATVARVEPDGMGVRFRLDAAGEERLGEIIARIAARQRRALVVDDDRLARSVITDALRERGFEVVTAADGLAGLDVLTDELLALDLVVTDLRMPEMDGESFLRMVRGPGGEQDLTVVVVAGTLDPFVEARLHEAGADAVLDKALGPTLIAEASDAALERKRLVREE